MCHPHSVVCRSRRKSLGHRGRGGPTFGCFKATKSSAPVLSCPKAHTCTLEPRHNHYHNAHSRCQLCMLGDRRVLQEISESPYAGGQLKPPGGCRSHLTAARPRLSIRPGHSMSTMHAARACHWTKKGKLQGHGWHYANGAVGAPR